MNSTLCFPCYSVNFVNAIVELVTKRASWGHQISEFKLFLWHRLCHWFYDTCGTWVAPWLPPEDKAHSLDPLPSSKHSSSRVRVLIITCWCGWLVTVLHDVVHCRLEINITMWSVIFYDGLKHELKLWDNQMNNVFIDAGWWHPTVHAHTFPKVMCGVWKLKSRSVKTKIPLGKLKVIEKYNTMTLTT